MCDLFAAWRAQKKADDVYDPAEQILLVDGYPRTVAQVGDDLEYRLVLHFGGLTYSQLLNRAAVRVEQAIAAGKCPRADDSPSAVSERLAIYLRTTLSAYAILEEAGVPTVKVDANKPILDIHHDLRRVLQDRGLW